MFKRRSVTAAKIEATKGTIESITPATDGAMNIYDFKFTRPNNKTKREQQGSFNLNTFIAAEQKSTITFRVDLVGGGSAEPLWATTFLPCCAMIDSSGTYTRDDNVANQKTCTIVHYIDGRKHTFAGCMGNAVFTITNGVIGQVNFTFTGKYMGAAAATLPTGITFPTTKPPRGFESILVAAYAPQTNNITLDLGNTVHLIEDKNDAAFSGFAFAVVSDAHATISIDPNAVVQATEDYEGIQFASTLVTAAVVVGVTANNIMTFTATSCAEILEIGDLADREGVVTEKITYSANAGFTVVFS